MLGKPAQHICRLGFHGRIVLLKHPAVAIMLIEFPRHHIHGSAPGHPSAATGLPGCTVRHIPGLHVLCVAHVAHPFAIERGGIEISHNGVHGHLPVAGVWRPFTMRAVACHPAMHIVNLAAAPDCVDCVEHRI